MAGVGSKKARRKDNGEVRLDNSFKDFTTREGKEMGR